MVLGTSPGPDGEEHRTPRLKPETNLHHREPAKVSNVARKIRS